MDLSEEVSYLLPSIILLLLTSPLHVQSLSTAPTTTTFSASNATDRLALLAFKSVISDPLGALNSWNDTHHFCQWRGVSCGRRHPERVTALVLKSLHLTGPLSPHITNLTFLVKIDLQNNSLTGNIPYEFGLFSRLKNISLALNLFDGEIPASITHCSNLVFVDLRYNKLTGRIPTDIGLLSNVRVLNLGGNNLTGILPPSIGNLSSLAFIFTQENSLEGSIPDSIGNLSELKCLQVAFNNLSGDIPSSFYNLSAIEIISAWDNSLTGSLPPTMFNKFPNLQMLLLNNNPLHGPIPISLPNASRLTDIEVSGNSLRGTIPAKLGNLRYLQYLQLDGTKIEATTASDWDFLTSLANCSQLVGLFLEQNRLSGNLPSSIGNLSPSSFNDLALNDNQISGTIPVEISKLLNLSRLVLRNNRLTGPIPDTIGNLQNLQQLFLSGNRLTGQLPFSIGNLTQLNLLHLQRNGLNGSIPASMGNMKNLQALNLSENKLAGAIPKELLSLSSLAIYLDLSSNLLSGPLPLEVGKLTNLNWLSVSNNNLSGEIPSNLGDCQSLEYLYLQANSFERSIPQSLSNLKGLVELDLSGNNLSGEIPGFLGRLGALVLLNLSHNDLEGPVPNEGVFRNASGISLLGDDRLCGGSSVLHLQACHAQSTGKKHLSLALKVIISILSVAALLVVSTLSYAAFHQMKKLRKKKSFQAPVLDQFAWISYADLLRATNGFSPSNLMGTGSFGSVYKGIMESDEKIVAVKVLNLERRGASRSFMSECETLRHVRHRNLVKIITACSGVDFKGNDFKALVLTYVSNGSLEKWLHPEEAEMRTLTLVQRLNIAIDVASALDYLHHHGQTPIAHCDLKPSNVLLDEEFCARVGDFGLARFLDETPEQQQTASSGIKGTIGYMAPEYGMGSQPSTQGDVYSYGILLLELFTGKRPTDEMLKDGLTLHKYVKMAFPERIMDILDPRFLLEHGQEDESDTQSRINTSVEEAECLASAISIGLKCSKKDSRERMEMGDVIKELQATRDVIVSTIWRKKEQRKESEALTDARKLFT